MRAIYSVIVESFHIPSYTFSRALQNSVVYAYKVLTHHLLYIAGLAALQKDIFILD